jgi:calcineurin-like phosphoesterase family protein
MEWFISDTHFGHKNVLEHDKRPFATIEEHDQTIIDNWNRVVGKNDVVYHLGDFNFRSPKTKDTDWYLNRLNGCINIIWGNHDDKHACKFQSRFASCHGILYKKIRGQKIHMCHYPIESWRACHHGSWMLHGHCHGKISTGRKMDLGVNLHNYTPVSFDQIAQIMSSRGGTEHHGQEADVN